MIDEAIADFVRLRSGRVLLLSRKGSPTDKVMLDDDFGDVKGDRGDTPTRKRLGVKCSGASLHDRSRMSTYTRAHSMYSIENEQWEVTCSTEGGNG